MATSKAFKQALQSSAERSKFATQDHPQGSLENYKSQIALDNQMKNDLMWLTSLDKQLMESPICTLQLDLIIESDAPHISWEAWCKENSTGSCHSALKTTYHINYWELLAAFLALKTFASQHMGTALLRIDNVSAVYNIYHSER